MFGPPKRSHAKTDRDVESLLSQARGGMRAGGRTERQKNLSSLRQRLESIEDASKGDSRLNALLRRLELAEENTEMNGRRPDDKTRPFGGRVRRGSRSSSDEDRESTELTSDESDSSTPTPSPPRRRPAFAVKVPGKENASELLSASRARGMEASLRRLRAELDQERKNGERTRVRAELAELRSAQRKASARGGAAQLASARESEGMRRLQNELDGVKRALVTERKRNAAPKVDTGATAVGVRIRARARRRTEGEAHGREGTSRDARGVRESVGAGKVCRGRRLKGRGDCEKTRRGRSPRSRGSWRLPTSDAPGRRASAVICEERELRSLATRRWCRAQTRLWMSDARR